MRHLAAGVSTQSTRTLDSLLTFVPDCYVWVGMLITTHIKLAFIDCLYQKVTIYGYMYGDSTKSMLTDDFFGQVDRC